MENETQRKMAMLITELQLVTETKLVLLIDDAGHELATSGGWEFRVNLRSAINNIGQSIRAVEGLKRLFATDPIWSATEGSETGHADIAILDGRWSVLFVFNTKDEADVDRSYVTPIVDALRIVLATTVVRPPGGEGTPPAGGGGGSAPPSPAELGIPIWWIRQKEQLRE